MASQKGLKFDSRPKEVLKSLGIEVKLAFYKTITGFNAKQRRVTKTTEKQAKAYLNRVGQNDGNVAQRYRSSNGEKRTVQEDKCYDEPVIGDW